MPCSDHAVLLKATAQHGRGTALARHGRGMGTACYVCVSALRYVIPRPFLLINRVYDVSVLCPVALEDKHSFVILI